MFRLTETSSRFANDLGLLLLRLGMSGLMLTHGIPKLHKLFAGGEIQFPDPLGVGAATSLALAVLGEVVAPALLILGFHTRLAAIPAAVTMAVAALLVHAGDPLEDREHALLFGIGFAVLAGTGAGRFSLDGWRCARASAKSG